tara:strand:- start:101 stop:262 length:162 start_codon:yes stop_codon:yes gene_type:complete
MKECSKCGEEIQTIGTTSSGYYTKCGCEGIGYPFKENSQFDWVSTNSFPSNKD